MSAAENYELPEYGAQYDSFDSPLMQQLRRESYGEDIGQHSWVTANDLREDILQLELSSESRLLDLGCGPGGPLAYISGLVGCRCIGVDSNTHAIAAGHARPGWTLLVYGRRCRYWLHFQRRSFVTSHSRRQPIRCPTIQRKATESRRVPLDGLK
jgi:hypothetical protein